MARLEYQANLGRGAHLKLAWKLGQELRPHKPGAGAAPARQPAAQWSAYRSTQQWLIPTTPFIRARYIKLISCKPIDRAAGTRTLPVPGKAHCSGPADIRRTVILVTSFWRGRPQWRDIVVIQFFFCVWHFASFESFSGFESPSIL
jgi:hypothetical protein